MSKLLHKRASRRQFLGLGGLAAVIGSVICVGGTLGYGVLKYFAGSARRAASRPADSPDRPTTLKQIDRPPITLRADWNAREPVHTAPNEPGFYSLTNVEGWREYEGDLRAIYRTVVVHHAALYETDDPSTMRDIQNRHMDERGWADIVYHFGVGKTGQIFEGRDLAVRGTHVEHYNTGSVGVVFFGNFEEELPAPEQIEAGRRLIDWLALRLELTHLAGHSEFNQETECPGRYLAVYLDALAASAGLMRGTGGYQPPQEQLITPMPES